jgi:hypothetical protein
MTTFVTQTSNMGLTVPVTGVDPGPDWANQINNSLKLIDAHDHSSGKGVKITQDGINITNDFSVQTNNLTGVKGLAFQSQTSNSSLTNTLYCLSGNLYYNDANGAQIQLTASGAIAAAAGNITTLSAPAAVVYASGLFDFLQNNTTSTEANIKFSSLVFKNNGSFPLPPTNGLVIKSPASIPTPYVLTLPSAAAGASGSLLTSDASGNLSYSNVDNATLQASSGVLSVKPLGVQQSNLYVRSTVSGPLGVASAGNVATANPNNAAISGVSLVAVSYLANLNTTGRPVLILPYLGPTHGAVYFNAITPPPTFGINVYVQIDGNPGFNIPIFAWNVVTSTTFDCPTATPNYVNLSAGLHTFQVVAAFSSSPTGVTSAYSNLGILVYEI